MPDASPTIELWVSLTSLTESSSSVMVFLLSSVSPQGVTHRGDFVKVGIPLTLLMWAALTAILAISYRL